MIFNRGSAYSIMQLSPRRYMVVLTGGESGHASNFASGISDREWREACQRAGIEPRENGQYMCPVRQSHALTESLSYDDAHFIYKHLRLGLPWDHDEDKRLTEEGHNEVRKLERANDVP